MRLCIIADGRSVHTQRWSAYFAGRHDVHLITYEPMGRSIPGVTEHVLATSLPGLYTAFWPRHVRIMRLVRHIRPDLVHAHFITKFGFHAAFLGFSPTVISAWGDDVLVLPPQSVLLKMATRFALARADLVYAVSRDIRNRIVADFGVPEEKVKHLPFGVDTSIFFPQKKAENRERIVLFSNRGFLPVYDMTTLVEGFALAYREEPSLSLVLKGEGPEKEAVRDRVQTLGIAHAVSFLPWGDYADVPRDLHAADIFITTARSDGTPVSLLEAMAAGLPCIATAVGGIPEWIEDGGNGLLIEPGNPGDVAEKMLMLARDEERRKAFGERARTKVEESGDWETLMNTAENDYSALIKQYRGNSA
ncbi:MAG: glycosyltransferase family 4 protein [Methanomicrobiales archaeon]|nr:glycosyltransferase family 4 protein [Methanomicrobiales archaeon]